MIQSFHCSDMQGLFEARRVKRFVNIEAVALGKRQRLQAAMTLVFQCNLKCADPFAAHRDPRRSGPPNNSLGRPP